MILIISITNINSVTQSNNNDTYFNVTQYTNDVNVTITIIILFFFVNLVTMSNM